MTKEEWLKKSEEILTDVKEWRREHRKATFVEIEAEVHRPMVELEAQLVEDAVQESESRVWGRGSEHQGPECPRCKTPLWARGEKTRRLQGNGGQTIKISRTSGSCPKCGQHFSPLDDELALLPGQLAPRQQNHLVHLASYMPFATAAQMMQELLEVQISKESARRLTQRMGYALEAAQTEAASAPFQEEAESTLLTTHLAMSADGAMIGLVGGEWVEVRTLVIGEIAPEKGKKKKKECQQEPRVQNVSSFSRLVDAEGFCYLAEVETRRRKVIQAAQVCAVMDGAEWLQEFTNMHRADAVRILDAGSCGRSPEHLAGSAR